MSWSILYWMIIHEGQQSDSSHLIDLVGGLLVVSDKLKPDDADPVPPVVVDVLGPGAALNVQQLPARDAWIIGRRGQTGSCGVNLGLGTPKFLKSLHERLKI